MQMEYMRKSMVKGKVESVFSKRIVQFAWSDACVKRYRGK